ncbi:hypothetical protein CCACVL1_03370 [Corchorus capsularis]|uniref:Uncharacterized protein n=1 Tax=Corchorus capsularis TaxID=210143 RepID=A0A1R3IVT5_COCAP|nr:hypothetical protein CCACVL1_09524 [Corchorus capsularis]OMP00343.1 hypothetical protein CCACVL1_03370 [Corchorus capsularis]
MEDSIDHISSFVCHYRKARIPRSADRKKAVEA